MKMGKEDEAKEKGLMSGCPVHVPKVDESKLLADCRSPRFFKACQKLQIDPVSLSLSSSSRSLSLSLALALSFSLARSRSLSLALFLSLSLSLSHSLSLNSS